MATSNRYTGDFDSLFEQYAPRVLAYASRRTSMLADAEDAVAETFVIAWRKFVDTPADPIPWLFAICRRVIANQRRATRSRIGLLDRLRAFASRANHDVPPTENPILDAFSRLKPDDREVLRLVAWTVLITPRPQRCWVSRSTRSASASTALAAV